MPAASKTQKLVNYILNEISTGRLRPGAKIPSATELRVIGGTLEDVEEERVSITVVREAINYLKATGVLVGVPGVGVFVAEESDGTS